MTNIDIKINYLFENVYSQKMQKYNLLFVSVAKATTTYYGNIVDILHLTRFTVFFTFFCLLKI